MVACGRCRNIIMPGRAEIGHGITAAPCRICGEQNYQIPPHMGLESSPAKPCAHNGCQDYTSTTHGRLCDFHRNSHREEGKKAWRKRKLKKTL